MSGRTTAWAWLTAWAIESSQSDHCGRTSAMLRRVVEPDSGAAGDSAATGSGDSSGLIAADHRARRPPAWRQRLRERGERRRRERRVGWLDDDHGVLASRD